MKFALVALVLASVVCVSQQQEILSLAKVLQWKKSDIIYDEFFPEEYIKALDEAIPGKKNCFPFCLNSNNADQLPYIIDATNNFYPKANVLPDDDIVMVVSKVVVSQPEMIANYIGGADRPTHHEKMVYIIKVTFEALPYIEDALYWTATLLQIGRDSLQQLTDSALDRVFVELELYRTELERTLAMENDRFKKIRTEFVQAVFLGGTEENFDTFVVGEIDELDKATLNFDKCNQIDDSIDVIKAALDIMRIKVMEGEHSPIMWLISNSLLDSIRDICQATAVEEQAGPAVSLDTSSFGISSSSSSFGSSDSLIGDSMAGLLGMK